MDLIRYLNCKVKIILTNGYYYVGKVLNADEDSLDLLDFKGQQVSLSKSIIQSIQEVKNE